VVVVSNTIPTNFLLYTTDDQQIKVDVLIEDETVWLNQAQMGGLFQKSKATISEHIKNIFQEGELQQELVIRDFRTTTQHGAIKGLTQSKNLKK
jgi:hypothetical protein